MSDILRIRKSQLRKLIREALHDPKAIREMEKWSIVAEDEKFTEDRYALLAKQVLNFWPERSMDTRWSVVVDKFIKYSEKNISQQIDKEKLMDAVELQLRHECGDDDEA